jgi:hypothetical protein
VLYSLRLATIQQVLPQGIVDTELFDVQDPHGYNSLARTLAFKHPCAAVGYNKSSKELSLSFNRHSEDFQSKYKAQKFLLSSIQQVMESYLRYTDDLSKVENLKGLIGLVVSKSHAYPLFAAHLPIPHEAKQLDSGGTEHKKFTAVLNRTKREISKLKTNGEQQLDDLRFFELYSELLASFQHSPSKVKVKYAKETLQPLLDITKICKLFAQQPLSFKELSNPSAHHAELAVLKHYKDIQMNLSDVEVGISRLTCAVCHTVLEHHKVAHVGTHGKFYVERASKVLDDFFSDDALCSAACRLLDQYITKQQSLLGKITNWEDLQGIEKKQLPLVEQEDRHESYLLDFEAHKGDITTTMTMLGLEMPEGVI